MGVAFPNYNKLGICDIIELLKQHGVEECTFYINGFMIEFTNEQKEEN